MLDLSFIRENPDLISFALERRGSKLSIQDIITKDLERRTLRKELSGKKQRQQQIESEFAQTNLPDVKVELAAGMTVLEEDLRTLSERMKIVTQDLQRLLAQVPNIPDMLAPDGTSAEHNETVQTFGAPPQHNFESKSARQIMQELGFVQTRLIAGKEVDVLVGQGVALSWALWNYMRQFFIHSGNTSEVLPSLLISKEHLLGAGKSVNNLIALAKINEIEYLATDTKTSLLALFQSQIIDATELTRIHLAFMPCRTEENGQTSNLQPAYNWGGIVFCEARHQESERVHEEFSDMIVGFLNSLNLHTQKKSVCTGQLLAADVKRYDVEVWTPFTESGYQTIATVAYEHDFLARRFGTTYINEVDENVFAHTVTGSLASTQLLLAALLENNQQLDGSVLVPRVLQPYVGADKFERIYA